jgi:hypothetical protein
VLPIRAKDLREMAAAADKLRISKAVEDRSLEP